MYVLYPVSKRYVSYNVNRTVKKREGVLHYKRLKKNNSYIGA